MSKIEDNNENLNNELNDNEMEAVAGGFKWPWSKSNESKWSPEQKEALMHRCHSEEEYNNILKKYTPETYVSDVFGGSIQAVAQIKEEFGLR